MRHTSVGSNNGAVGLGAIKRSISRDAIAATAGDCERSNRMFRCLPATVLALMGAGIPALSLAGPVEDNSAASAISAGNEQAMGQSAASDAIGEIVVAAHHITTETIDQASMQKAVPGSNPLKALMTLPGVSIQSDDPQGVDVWGTQLYIHGFQQSEIGATLDGIPLGEMTFYPYNGLNPVEAVSAENVQRLSVSESAGAEGIASANNLGGSLEYFVLDPKNTFGATVSQSFGSNSTYHTFVRADSGALNSSGTKFFVSYMRNDTQRWRGSGEQFYQQVNAKLIQPVGKDSSIEAYFDWDDLHQDVYTPESPDLIKNLSWLYPDAYHNGKASGYITAYNVALAVQGLGGEIPSYLSGVHDPIDAAYYNNANNDTNMLGYIKADLALAERLRWVTTLYLHSQQNQNVSTSPYAGSPNGAPLSETTGEGQIHRYGVVSKVSSTLADNTIEGGAWYEHSGFVAPSYQYQDPLVVDGVVAGGLPDALDGYKNPFNQLYSQTYNTDTVTAFVQDTYRPLPGLDLHAGFKSLFNTTRISDGALDEAYYGVTSGIVSGVSVTTSEAFLPHISADYHFLEHHELFADISKNARSFAPGVFEFSPSPFAQTMDKYRAFVESGGLRPETAWTYTVGYRYQGGLFDASLFAYRSNFSNRLATITSGTLLTPNFDVVNIGSVTMNGVDAQFVLRPIEALSLTNNISYNHGVYDNDLNLEGITYNTKNQQIVNYPRWMYKAHVQYDWRDLSVYADANYVGKRNYTYTGDLTLPSYWTSSAGVSYEIRSLSSLGIGDGVVKSTTISFSVTNLNNAKYGAISGILGNSTTRATGEYLQSIDLSAPRMFFVNLKCEF